MILLLTILLGAWRLVPGAKAQFSLVTGTAGAGATEAAGGAYTLHGTAGQAVGGVASGGGYEGGQGLWYQVETAGGGTLLVRAVLTAFLEGAYDAGTGLMRTDLNSGGLLGQSARVHPYAGPPWSYDGSEAVAAGFFVAHPTIVDWVLVQLRTGTPAAPPMTVAAQRAALLRSDGAVVDLDGTSPVAFSGLAPGAYFVAVFHRNHLPAMSALAVDFSGGDGAHDFSAAAGTYGTNATVLIAKEIFGLWAGNGAPGDGTTNERIQPADNAVWQAQFGAGAQGYAFPADYTLNGRVQPDDQTRWRASFAAGAQSAVPAGQ